MPIIDGPPRVAEITRTILVMSDLCLFPLGKCCRNLGIVRFAYNDRRSVSESVSGGCAYCMESLSQAHAFGQRAQ